jgi:hypothetical protein
MTSRKIGDDVPNARHISFTIFGGDWARDRQLNPEFDDANLPKAREKVPLRTGQNWRAK